MTVNILIVDDHLDSRFSTQARVTKMFSDLDSNELIIKTAATIDELYAQIKEFSFHVILLDRDLGKDSEGKMIDGVEHIENILELRPKTRLYVLTSFEDISLANKARDYGAHGYLTKNPSEENQRYIDAQIKQAVKDSQLELEFERIKAVRDSRAATSYVSKSHSMKRIEGNLKSLAEINTPVLITGDSGLGKTYTAKRLHKLTEEFHGEKNRAFLYKDINTIPKTLQISELFGHEKGSFTGASERKMGLFELATGGTLFLDEIGDATPELQGALLNVIEEKSYRRLGGKQDLKINARIIFATNKNLEALVASGEFRRDLYARICAIEIEMPPLSERKEDIPLICEFLSGEINRENGKNISFNDFPATLKQYFVSANFPDNIRGIRNDLVRLAAFCPIKQSGKVDYSSWRSILNYTKKPNHQNRISQKTLDSIVEELAQYVGSPNGPGLAAALDLLEYKSLEYASSKYKKRVKQAEILKLKPSTLQTKKNKYFKKELNG